MNYLPNHRRALALTVSAALAMATGNVRAAASLGGGELYASGILRAEYDSNIFANNLEEEDVLFRLTPGLIWVRDAGLVRAEVAGGVEFQQFCDYTDENSSNPYGSLDLDWAREEGKSEGRLAASYRRNSFANPTVNERTKSDDLSFTGSVGHFATEKFGYRLKGTYLDQDYLTTGYSSVRKASAAIEGRYQYSPKLETVLGYTFRDSATRKRFGRASVNSTDHRFLLGFDGELLPKVTGRLAAGYVYRSFSSAAFDDESGLVIETALDWTPDPDTTVTVFAERDFDTSPVDQTIRSFRTGVDFARKVTPKFTVSAGISYEHANYVGGPTSRTDDVVVVRGRASYAFTERIEAGADLNNRATNSTLAISDCNKLVAGAFIGARF